MFTHLKDEFRDIYNSRRWKSEETRSGGGSTMSATKEYRRKLAVLVERLGVKSILDAGCGDCNFMERWLEGRDITYIGVDIVPEAVEDCRKQCARSPNMSFQVADITTSKLPDCELVIVKDVIQHLSVWDAFLAVQNVQATKAEWLLINHFADTDVNRDTYVHGGGYYNMCLPPFNLPQPLQQIPKVTWEVPKFVGLWARRQWAPAAG